MELWGNKRPHAPIVNFRDVTLYDEYEKVDSGHNRNASSATAETLTVPPPPDPSNRAIGSGFNSGACDAARLLINEQLAHAMRMSVSVFVIFAALKTAFASLHRNIPLMDPHTDDEVWLMHLAKCRFTADQAKDNIQVACTWLK